MNTNDEFGSKDEQFLHLAEFLTKFQSFYSVEACDQEEEEDNTHQLGPITPQDLQKVLAYRQLVEKTEQVQQDEFLFEYHNEIQHGSADNAHNTSYSNLLQQCHQELAQQDDRIAELNFLLECFEVWSTKALAQHVLLSHHHDRASEMDASCWSMLLSLPSSSYSSALWLPVEKKAFSGRPIHKFAKIWHEIYNTQHAENYHHPCGLSVPPNIHTWQEYLRIARIVSLLPTDYAREAAHKSRLCGDERLFRGTTQVKFSLDQADLVSLWVRAQRNSQARRHLVQLFTISKEEGKDTYKAIYQGNHRLMHRRVIQESPMVDTLVQWAVVNQVLATHKQVLQRLKEPLRRWRKRRLQDPPISPLFQPLYKRRKIVNQDDTLTAEQQKSLLWACQRYILRWFAQRNRQQLTVLFFSNAREAEMAREAGVTIDVQSQELLSSGICDIVRDKLKSNDRTLPRIDRRVAIDKYNDEPDRSECVDCFHEAVLILLEAFEQACQELEVSTDETVRSDFDTLYRSFQQVRTQKGLVAAARTFCDGDVRPHDLADLLLDFPAPWIERCCVCQRSVFKDTKGFRICACCDSAFHEECIHDKTTYNAHSFIKSCPALGGIFAARIPGDLAPPDFGDGLLTWEKKVITLHRRPTENGGLQKLGLSLRQTERCGEALQRMLSGLFVSQLDADVGYPVAVPHVGSLVVAVSQDEDSCCKNGAIKVGDVITGLQLLDYVSQDAEQKYQSSVVHDFSKTDRETRLRLFRESAKTLRLIVERPSENIVAKSCEWVAAVRKYNGRLKDCLASTERHLWLCKGCHGSTQPHNGPESELVRMEATRCKAVIRRLSVYAESICLHYENSSGVNCSSNSGDSGEQNNVPISLKRLDSMMDWIILQNSVAGVKEGDLGCSPFFANGRRLPWATEEMEKTPYDLLCRGIASFVSRSWHMHGVSRVSNKSPEQELLKQFVTKFAFWCLASEGSSELPISSRGPSLFAKCASFPSTRSSCHSCGVRFLESPQTSTFCQQCVGTPEKDDDFLGHRVDDAVKSYEACTSLVGTAILCTPEDPMLVGVLESLQKQGVIIEHKGRPVEFIVVSYLPGDGDIENDQDGHLKRPCGVFHLLPIVNPKQLDYLLNRCRLRQECERLTKDVIENDWTKDGILDLDGVLTLSYDELVLKVKETRNMHSAITNEVAHQAQCTCPRSLDNLWSGQGASASVEQPRILPCSSTDCLRTANAACLLDGSDDEFPLRHLSLIDSLVRSRAPMMLRILGCSLDESITSESKESSSNQRTIAPLVSPQLLFQGEKSSLSSENLSLEVDVPKPAKEGLCELMYTDILFTNPSALKQFAESIELPNPSGADESVISQFTFVLSAVSAKQPWGLELVRWRREEFVRIGRVVQGSLADKAGLRSGDILDSINGASLASFDNTSLLACVLLSLSDRRISRHNCGPLVIRIRRESPLENSASIHQARRGVDGPSREAIVGQRVHQARRGVDGPSREAIVGQRVADRHADDRGTQLYQDQRAGHPCLYQPSDIVREVRFLRGKIVLERHRQTVTRSHLYRPGPPGTVLTLLETSILLGAVERGYPILGVRLLCPRYEVRLVYMQLQKLCNSDLGQVPYLISGLWKALVKLDYQRSEVETKNGDLVFEDCNSCRYRMPTNAFPIDPIIEAFFQGQEWAFSETYIRQIGTRFFPLIVRDETNSNPWRIRGGGSEEPLRLASLEVSEWPRTLVHGKCKTTHHGDSRGEATFIAFVESSKSDLRAGVKVFFLSNVGICSSPFSQSFDSKQLYVVDDASEEAHITRQYGGYKLERHGAHGLRVIVDERNDERPAANGCDAQEQGRRSTEDVFNVDRSQNNERDSRAQEISPLTIEKMFSPPKTGDALGVLPDGRLLYWFSSDPTALYMSPSECYGVLHPMAENQQQQLEEAFSAEIEESGRESICGHCCVWGCTVRKGSEHSPLSFASRVKLLEHLREHHALNATSDGLVRVPEGENIMSLSCGIAAAACTANSSLLPLTKKLDSSATRSASGFKFFRSPNSNLIQVDPEIDDNSIMKMIRQLPKSNSRSLQLLFVGRSVSRLFDCDGIAKDESSRSFNADALPSDQNPAVHTKQGHEATDCCFVCNTMSEAIVLGKDGGYAGIGCASPCSLLFECANSDDSRLLHPKKLLLSISGRIPNALHLKKLLPGVKGAVSRQLWDDDFLSTWRSFVIGSSLWRSLVQAFVVLVGSVDHSKLPKWWASDGSGWSHVQAVMETQSLSALMQQLYVFDAALAEFTSGAITDTSNLTTCVTQRGLPSELSGLEFDEVVYRVLSWARKCGLDLFDGVNAAYCCMCADGGEMLCCELCANVQHASCVLPKGLSETPERFVCHSCIVDVHAIFRSIFPS